MLKLSKQEAIELDAFFKAALFIDIYKFHGLVSAMDVAKTTSELKDKNPSYIGTLLYKARLAQQSFPTLFQGSGFLQFNNSAIKDFLHHGGFQSIYEKQRKEDRKGSIEFRLIIIAAITGIGSLLYSAITYHGCGVTNNKKLQDKSPKQQQITNAQSSSLKSETTKVPPNNKDSS